MTRPPTEAAYCIFGFGSNSSRNACACSSRRATGTPVALFLSCKQPGKLDSEQPEIYLTGELRFWPSAAFTERGDAGNCSTVAC
jgi:hypothetical protein